MPPRAAAPPDHLRCHRNDGRGWRCVRPAIEKSSFCRLHFVQYRLRQSKKPVPESLKLHRGSSPGADHAGALNPSPSAETSPTPTPCGAVRKIRLKKKDAALWVKLVSMDLRRRIENDQRRQSDRCRKSKFFVRDLPNGTMSVSPRSEALSTIADDDRRLTCSPKIGLDDNLFFHRCFRSKNVQPVPLSGFQIVSCSRDLKQRCHQCGKASFISRLLCFKCQEELYCKNCYQQFYSQISVEDFKASCPRCRGCCSCENCSDSEPRAAGNKELVCDQKVVDRILNAHYIICLLLPILKKMNRDQKFEFDTESTFLGSCPPAKQLQPAKCDASLRCNYCMASIVDMHRSCSSCSFNLCIKCCQQIRIGNGLNGIRSFNGYNKLKSCDCCLKSHSKNTGLSSRIKWKTNEGNGTITCPSKELGGCGTNILELRCVFPLNWAPDLEMVAEEIACLYDIPALIDLPSTCSLCPRNCLKDAVIEGNLREASWRLDSDDNYLYSPSQKDIRAGGIEHFQQHWIRGHPIIVRDIVGCSSELSWDPFVLFQSLPLKDEAKLGENANTEDVNAEKHSNGCSKGRTNSMLFTKILKQLEWLPLCFLRDQLPKQCVDLVDVLPLQEYTNPDSGSLNLAMKLPTESLNSEEDSFMHNFYWSKEKAGGSRSITNLSVQISDVVNVLMHVFELPAVGRQIGRIEKKKRRLLVNDENKCFRMSLMQLISSGETKEELHQIHEVSTRQKILREDFVNEASDITYKKEGFSVGNCEQTPKQGVQSIPDRKEAQRFYSYDTKVVNKAPGVQWDVFRREDVPKLVTYLQKNLNKPWHPYYASEKCISHPLHDRCFFLNTAHKRKLKEEYQVEPWTFVQHAGEAVIVPAGCPYQLKNLQCCVKVGMDFISPESGWKCIQLADELRLLPDKHKARRNDVEIEKIILHGIRAAVYEIQKSTSTEVLSRR